MTIIDYVTEEVRRQGHDVAVKNGLIRVSWMLHAWTYALEENRPRPTLSDAIILGRLVEPGKNKNGTRQCRMRVGSEPTPDPDDVDRLLTQLFANGENLTPIEFYKAFELIHPFVDGNGRTGKILLNWLNGTLYNPIFPPADLFGEPILNP